MQESMYQYMKVGTIHFMSYPATMKGEGPVLETVEKIVRDSYFTAIELTWIKDAAVKKAVKKLLEQSHMTVSYGGQPRLLTTGLNINDLDEAGREKAVMTLKEGIDEAYEMGAVGFVFLSGKYEEATKEQSYKALVKSTKELCRYAASKGSMRVVLEVFDYDVDKKSIIGPVNLAKRFAEEIRAEHDNFGLLVDLSHLPLLRETAEQAILPVKDYIVHAHIGNAVVKDPAMPAYGDAHPRFGFPNGENDVDQLASFLRVLKEIGFLNTQNPPVVSFEVKPWGDEDPDLILAGSKRVLNEAWARV
jgi:sugar phosphate isomerase/epimerase